MPSSSTAIYQRRVGVIAATDGSGVYPLRSQDGAWAVGLTVIIDITTPLDVTPHRCKWTDMLA